MIILTAAPDSIDLARAELRQAMSDASFLPDIAPGVMRAQGDFFALAEQWRRRPPIFVRHICPAQTAVSLTGSDHDINALRRAAAEELLDLVDPALPFSVQTRIFGDAPYKPFDINNALSQLIQDETNAPLDVRRPFQILSAVIIQDRAYLGLSPTLFNLSDWAGGARRFAREQGQISRAEFKLLEALEVFQIELPPRGAALDLGAAPGGWTRVLRQKKQYVTAVDPAHLRPSLQADKQVRHKQMTAETYLADDPDQFDLIVNDMRLDARDSARLMVRYAPYLYSHGIAIMTLKLPKLNRTAVLDHSFNILRPAYRIANARQLFHNRSEITVSLVVE
ncbi:MAG: 50S rRNA methyltransferase [Chloroflexi bacterium]|nr:50S rRNA methyltransferase [Chloroflexota bacterium]